MNRIGSALMEKGGCRMPPNDIDLFMGIGFLVLGILFIIIGFHRDWWY